MPAETRLQVRQEKIKGLGLIHKLRAPFADALEAFETMGNREKAEVISLRNLAYVIIKSKDRNALYSDGTYTREAFIHRPQNPSLALSNSPFLDINLTKTVTQLHRTGRDFYPPYRSMTIPYLEQEEEDRKKEIEQKRVLALKQQKSLKIPTNRFNQEEFTRWAFKDQAKDVGQFFYDRDIKEMSVLLADETYVNSLRPFVTQMWFDAAFCRIHGNCNPINYPFRYTLGISRE